MESWFSKVEEKAKAHFSEASDDDYLAFAGRLWATLKVMYVLLSMRKPLLASSHGQNLKKIPPSFC